MSEMSDQEVQERLSKYRRRKKFRVFGAWCGVAVAAAIVLAMTVRLASAVSSVPEDPLKTKPLPEWTQEEKTSTAPDLYYQRLRDEPIDWANMLTTGFAAPGKHVFHGDVLRKTLALCVVLPLLAAVLRWLLAVVNKSLPVTSYVLRPLSWLVWVVDVLFAIWILLVVCSLVWRVLV